MITCTLSAVKLLRAWKMWWKCVLCFKILLVAKTDSISVNQTSYLLYQNWGRLRDTALTTLNACRVMAKA